MKIYTLERESHVGMNIQQAWEFFSNPRNLATITPPELNLIPNTPLPAAMYAGMIITYKLRVGSLLRTTWVTEITHVNPPHLFVDEQRLGPYAFWHHQHLFASTEQGTIVRDLVHYALPLDPLSRPANALLVSPHLTYIFAYRARMLADMFPVILANSSPS